MSTRVEYINAASCSVEYVNERDLAENLPNVEQPKDRMVLALGYDEVVVIEGSPEQLRDFAQRITNAVQADQGGQQ